MHTFSGFFAPSAAFVGSLRRMGSASVAMTGSRYRHAMSLTEVMVAMSLFIVVAAGVLSIAVQARRSINETLMRNIAFDAANNVLDQLKAQKFGTLLNLYKAPPVTASSCFIAYVNDYAHAATSRVTLFVNGKVFREFSDNTGLIGKPSGIPLGDERIPFNQTASAGNDGRMVYLPNFAVKVDVAPVLDANVGTSVSGPNALLVTVSYRYGAGATETRAVRTLRYVHPNI